MLILLATLAHAAIPDDALTALRRGDCEAALERLADSEGLEAAMGRAACGETAQLEALLDEGGVLEPYARLLLARQAVETDPARAEALLEGVSLAGEAGLEVRLLRAQAQIAQDRSLDARPDLRKLLNTSVHEEARFWLAFGAEARGEDDAAVAVYRTSWSENVGSPFSARSAERLAELGHPVPDFGTAEGRALALTRARKLVKAFRADEAIPLYDGITDATGESSTAWTYEVAFALFKAKDYPRSMEWMARLEPTQSGTKGGSDTLFHFALGTSRAGDYAAAAEHYARLVELYPSHKIADTASFKIPYLAYDEARLEEAIPLFWAHLERYPASKHKDEALWFIGWSHYRLGQLEESEAALDRVVKEHGGSSLAPGALYWKARIRGQRGDAEGETAALERLINSYPVSGHAWFASHRVGRTFAGIEAVAPPPLPATFLAAHPEVAEAQALADAGQWGWARQRLMGAVPAAKAAGKTTALAMAHELIRVGAFKDAQALARPFCPKPWKAASDPVAVTACYPRPERSVVEESTAQSGLNPLLPYAIMTAESALDPSVTSPAGARGLMQLMPDLGEELNALLLPGSTYDPDRLYVAGYNAWLGTTELGRLYKDALPAGVDPALPLAIAGYNGGADAVQRWLADYESPPDADWFAENISYSETRRYVKRVLGYLMGYRWIYGDG